MFAGGMIRLEVIKTDGVFPIIFGFFVYGTLFNIAAGLLLVDYLGPVPSTDAFLSIFLVLISIFYFIPTGIVILWAPTQIGAGICSILFLSEIIVGAVSSSRQMNHLVGVRLLDALIIWRSFVVLSRCQLF